MSLARALWRANADLAEATLRHPFVRGLGDGSLPRVAFEGFILQDTFFLDAFARAYALALARSPDREGVYDFAELLGGVLDELKLHGSYASQWGISVTDVTPVRATLEYTDFLLATAALRGVGETCAAMTPCMRLYAFLGQSLSAEPHERYVEWVRTYAGAEFEALAARLEGLLDRYADDNPGVRSAYRRALELELGFFEAAWRRD